jgi:Homeodomain-like domain
VPGASARTDRRSLETLISTPTEAASQLRQGDATRQDGKAATTGKKIDLPIRKNCAMTSTTNRNSEGENQRAETQLSPVARQQRRQEALQRYLAGDPIEVICREMSCSKSWLYKGKNRYQVTEPDWVKERSRRPQPPPTKTPEVLEAEIVRLRQALSPDDSGTVSADVIRDHLRRHGGDWIPSRRTVYRILKRQA